MVARCTIVPAAWLALNVTDTQPWPELGRVLVLALIPVETTVPPVMVSAPFESRPPSPPPRVADPATTTVPPPIASAPLESRPSVPPSTTTVPPVIEISAFGEFCISPYAGSEALNASSEATVLTLPPVT